MVEKGPKIPADWVGKQRWNEILTLSTLHAFQGFSATWTWKACDNVLKDYFAANTELFKPIYDCVEADREPLPGPWQERLSLKGLSGASRRLSRHVSGLLEARPAWVSRPN